METCEKQKNRYQLPGP